MVARDLRAGLKIEFWASIGSSVVRPCSISPSLVPRLSPVARTNRTGQVRRSRTGTLAAPISLASPLLAVMEVRRWMRRFDFDAETVVRLVWRGLPPINLPAPVRYFRPEEGGVSHFNYVRDNLLLSWMHARLFTEFLLRLPWLAWRRACKDRRT